MEIWQILLGSGVAVVALIDLIGKLILWRKNRNAQVEDKNDEQSLAIEKLTDTLNEYMDADKTRADALQSQIKKLVEDVGDIKTKQDKQAFALQISLQNTILYRGAEAIKKGSISVDEYARMQKLAEGAKAVGADGVVTATMNALEKIIG